MKISTAFRAQFVVAAVLILSCLLTGCEDGGLCLFTCEDAGVLPPDAGGGGPPVASGGLPCAVKTIVDTKCSLCHGNPAAFGAPMSLTNQAQFQVPAVTNPSLKAHQVVKTRINASVNPMPPPTNGTLTPSELAAFNSWLDQGAPVVNETCNGTGPGPSDPNVIDTRGLECYKMLAHAQGNKNAKFKVGAVTDAYWNFGFQAPWQGMVYGIVVKPIIDNAQVLHHWLLYKESVADGSITPTIGQHAGGELIHGWAPGGTAMDFRTHGSVGFELPDSTYSVEIHYNSSDPNAEDASGVEVCVQRNAPQNVASMSWVGYDQGGTLSYASGICFEPSTTWTGTCAPNAWEPIHIIYVTPHLHQAGRHLKSVINGPNGQRVLHDKPFDFAYQITYEKNEVLMPGESITTTCTFSEPKCAGQSTTQEMCYLFTYAYPKHTLVDNGFEGTFMHGEGACLGQ
jgi:hypothetical protein